MSRTAGLVLGLLLSLPAGAAAAAGGPNLYATCIFDPTESGPGRDGTVADGLGGMSVSLLFDFGKGVAAFGNGSTVRLTKVDADTIEFVEQDYTVSYRRDSGDLISHDGKTAYDGVFHCVAVPHA